MARQTTGPGWTKFLCGNNDRFFDEGAAQVRKLLNRDRQEMLGLEEIGDNFRAEFEEEGASTPQTQDQEEAEFRSSLSQPGNNNSPTTNKPAQPRMNGAKPASPFGSTGSSSPFASSSPPKAAAPSAAGKSPPGRANPFGGSVAKKPFNEPVGLSPGMQPADMDEEPWWKKITVAQVVIVVSFTLIISLMLGTFALVYKVGGVRFNE
ncbi:hypothetical protein WJX72_007333 [[Myrmecia] bisecta]|uniref:Uncharacterized protein n=1 Tax=[Myrmecia] bisecta TaxID=41462 RepID=A0AAW1Q7T3_9CHLO